MTIISVNAPNEIEKPYDRLLDSIQKSENFIDLAFANYDRLENGALAFCSQYLEIDHIPRIVDFLPDSHAKITFLEYCVYDKKFSDYTTHQALFNAYLDSLPSIYTFTPISQSDEPVRSLRKQFVKFIYYCNVLDPITCGESIDKHFINEKLASLDKCHNYEECADLISESGVDINVVIELCDSCMNPNIYTYYAKNLDDKEKLCQLLNERGGVMNTKEILNLITTKKDLKLGFNDLKPFFEKITTQRSEEIRSLQIQQILDEVVINDKKARLSKLENGSVEIGEETPCAICLRKIGKSKFCLTPENLIAHQTCMSKM
ncbi:hypothetical protein TRFO_22549 [Tritrichomonas foetus]|uniref:Vacuolar sorting protein 39/Transforming growth factor beta receptor-associated zinc finger domain-containing protein n=1 Tax=Tritrichomonas foetus TaxID=1144522 RepID=A0A1J4KCV6_9EUKA|nr:hypothetical protein TRFO_22549 [Tritrichomonas foetus]|eukprot:OHT08802.1 hypothetical protein TRFO_22549 [Tritrichomonas foetus]